MRIRGTILIASANPAFADLVGEMVLEAGFAPAYPRGLETPWVTVARTQPRVVICDCDTPVSRVQRLVFDASARRVPVVVSRTTDASVDLRSLATPSRVALLTFPVSQEAFSSMLEALVLPVARSSQREASADAAARSTSALPVWEAPPRLNVAIVDIGPERRRVSPRRSSLVSTAVDG